MKHGGNGRLLKKEPKLFLKTDEPLTRKKDKNLHNQSMQPIGLKSGLCLMPVLGLGKD